MKPIYKYEIKRVGSPYCGYRYYVRELTSVDGGEHFYNCGNGLYFKTGSEARAYRDRMKMSHLEPPV